MAFVTEIGNKPSPSMAARKKKRKRKRVPEVLWRLFGNRARTLADTILALIPQPPDAGTTCCCKGKKCLCCSGDEAISFLVRSGDSPDYRKLLTGCFVVVVEDAPPVPVFDPHCRWSQREIVRRSIEIILREQPSTPNLICCSYDKDRRSSAAVDELTSAKWTVLLRRVGDAIMMYLLRYASIFLPLPRKKHHQISGYPISDLCSKNPRHSPEPRSQNHSPANRGSAKKRKWVEGDAPSRKQLRPYTLKSDPSSNSTSSATSNGSSCVTQELTHTQREENTKQNNAVPRKRTREFSWQRQRKRRQLVVQGTSDLISCRGNSSISYTLPLISSSSQCDIGVDMNTSHCLCCSVFKSEPRMKGNAEIERKYIFHRIESCSSMLPSNHILNKSKPNGSGASNLFKNIFNKFGPIKIDGSEPCCHRGNGCSIKSTCLYHSFMKLLESLIHETQNCRHVRLLERHCSAISSCQDGSRGAVTGSEVPMIPETNTAQAEPIKHCTHNQVISFIWAICRRIVPSSLLGEPSNWRSLRRNMSKFIKLRRFEKFSLKECIYKLKILKFPILSNKHTRCSGLGITDIGRQAILECWMFWFFEHLISPLLQANFYVTESEHGKQEVLYYRKSTWENMMRGDECLADDRYRLLTFKSARNILRDRSLGFSRARLLPKSKGFRMLCNLGAPSRFPVYPPSSRVQSNQKSWIKEFCSHKGTRWWRMSVNRALHDVHVVIKGLQAKEPEKLGSSVFDYNDIYKKLVPFLFHLKNGSTSLPNVFMVVSDVSKAFDSVDHYKLLSVMKDVILDDEFSLEKFTLVNCMGESLKINQHLILAHGDIAAASTRIRSRFPTQSLDSIVVKKEPSKKISKEEINSLLKEHIMRNVVQLGDKFYLQRIGIPQGSVLSALLCSFYYGHMEKNVVFPFLEKCNEELLAKHHSPSDTSASGGNHKMELSAPGCDHLLLRFIDDFLFISTSVKQASMFFSRLERGVRDYNCCMNEEKYGLNFIMENRQGCQSNRLHIGKDGISFLRWSGLLVNCSTLEIQADYTRYLNYNLRSTLTVCRKGKVGQKLKAKLRHYLRPKCHPVFYDSNINSPGVVRLNIYQAFLVCAMKFISHLSNLSILPRFNPKFCFNAIEDSLRYMNKLIKRRMCTFKVDPCFRPKYDVKGKDVIWLGLYAYSRVLKKKQSRYKSLLRLFMSKLKAYGEVNNMPSELRYAVDDVHSSVLWGLKF